MRFMNELTKPAVHVLAIEQSALELIEEFLRGWFDGQTHTLGGTDLVFPHAHLRFQQSSLPQPLNGLSITTLFQPGRSRRDWSPSALGEGLQEWHTEDVTFSFWVRASLTAEATRTGQGNNHHLVREGADRLLALLSHSDATQPLAAKGIAHWRARLPQLVAEGAYAVRLITAKAQLRYGAETQLPTQNS